MIFAVYIGIKLANPTKGKLGAFWQGRKNQRRVWHEAGGDLSVRPVWVHASSVGEYLQVLPVVNAIRQVWPDMRVVWTFFSPSGYEYAKNRVGQDTILYLPIDLPWEAKHFVDKINPLCVIWAKYDFYLNILMEIKRRSCPAILVSAAPKVSQFSGLASWFYAQAYGCFDKAFVQYQANYDALPATLQAKAQVAGDTRYDQVASLRQNVDKLAPILPFFANREVLVCGSFWQQDADLLFGALAKQQTHLPIAIFPHEFAPGLLDNLKKQAPQPAKLLSEVVPDELPTLSTFIVDKIGLLSQAYSLASITWVGGGNGRNLHNILEAAVWGKPVLYGIPPTKFPEGAMLIEAGGGFAIPDAETAAKVLTELIANPPKRAAAGQAARTFVLAHTGATAIVSAYVLERLALDNVHDSPD